MKTMRTKNYDLFAFEIGNREYKDWWADRLSIEIKKKNMLELHPIVCTKRDGKLFIIDGQHRFNACKKLGIDVIYVEVSGLTPNDIATLNANQRGWGTKDYLNHYVQLGVKGYALINKYIEETGFAVSVACNLCQGKSNEGGNGNGFKLGKINVSDSSIKLAYRVADICKLMKNAGIDFSGDRSLVKAIHSILIAYPAFEPVRFVSKVKRIPFEKRSNWVQYVEQVEHIYNNRCICKNKVPLMGLIKSSPKNLMHT